MECSFTRAGTHSPSRLGIWRRARLLPNENVDSSNANRYLEEIAHVLEFRFFDQQAIESLPGGGHSWVELARTVISRTISPDLTDIDILAYAYCILMEKGQSNEIMTEALKIQLLWLQGLSIS